MATIARISIPADAFPLGSIFRTLPDAVVELERLVPTTDTIFPYFWVSGVDTAAVTAAVEAHDGIASVTLVEDLGDTGLFRGEWNEDVEGIVSVIDRSKLSLLTAIGKKDEWRLEFRAEESTDITEFQRQCREIGLPIDLTRLYTLTKMRTGRTYDLTEEQHEALVLAFERGYFDEPREAALDEIARELGITRQSLAGRLRRGFRNLITSTIVDP